MQLYSETSSVPLASLPVVPARASPSLHTSLRSLNAQRCVLVRRYIYDVTRIHTSYDNAARAWVVYCSSGDKGGSTAVVKLWDVMWGIADRCCTSLTRVITDTAPTRGRLGPRSDLTFPFQTACWGSIIFIIMSWSGCHGDAHGRDRAGGNRQGFAVWAEGFTVHQRGFGAFQRDSRYTSVDSVYLRGIYDTLWWFRGRTAHSRVVQRQDGAF